MMDSEGILCTSYFSKFHYCLMLRNNDGDGFNKIVLQPVGVSTKVVIEIFEDKII